MSSHQREGESDKHSQQDRPKRGRGRPAFRPFDLPSRYPLKRTSDDGDSSISNESSKARLAQRRIDNYLML